MVAYDEIYGHGKTNELSPLLLKGDDCSYRQNARDVPMPTPGWRWRRGISNQEIQDMFSGASKILPPANSQQSVRATLCGHRYPSRKSWDRMLKIYGESKARGILGPYA
ncbi:MAG: hypothetical protein U5N58_05010 [Actinomycetota bacterium]|nr:hypothetical protein [Actinomycetota bacterium]